VWGAVVGSTVITVLVQVLNNLGTRPGMPSYASSVFSHAVYALLILVLLFLPRGLLPSITGRLRQGRPAAEPPAPRPAGTAEEALGGSPRGLPPGRSGGG